jgi:carboxylesterase type B
MSGFVEERARALTGARLDLWRRLPQRVGRDALVLRGQLARRAVNVVTIAYRLNPLGLLAHPKLTRESPHRSSGNYGLMDQIAALEKIQRNIAAFGGDAKRFTIADQSSGAISVSVLMAL